MKLFPAIDILNGKCVRLLFGEKDKVTEYGDAADMGEKWQKLGAEFLHVVDLDGAFSGDGKNLEIVRELVRRVNIPVQLGGGIRTMQDIEERLTKTGVDRVILGTVAAVEPELVRQAVKQFGSRIACGIDVKNGKVSIKGWTQEVEETPVEFGKKLKSFGVETVIYTDISRDGALSGVNVESTAKLQRETGLQVIASGGVSSLDDLTRLKECGVYGAILGKSLYTGAVDLAEALCLARE